MDGHMTKTKRTARWLWPVWSVWSFMSFLPSCVLFMAYP